MPLGGPQRSSAFQFLSTSGVEERINPKLNPTSIMSGWQSNKKNDIPKAQNQYITVYTLRLFQPYKGHTQTHNERRTE